MTGYNFLDLPSDLMTMIMNINKNQEREEAYKNKERHRIVLHELTATFSDIDRFYGMDDVPLNWREAPSAGSEIKTRIRCNNYNRLHPIGFVDISDEEYEQMEIGFISDDEWDEFDRQGLTED